MVKPKSQPITLSLPAVALDQHANNSATNVKSIILNLSDFERELPGICQRIFETLGSQQSEGTYQRCLYIDLLEAGVEKVHLEVDLPLTYKGVVVSSRRADMIVELACGGRALLEFKAVKQMSLDHRKQIEYYLHNAEIDEGYLINFPHDPGFPDVTSKSSFDYNGLAGLTDKLQSLLLVGGPVLRLRNDPKHQEVEVVHIHRKDMNTEERKAHARAAMMAASSPMPVAAYGITKRGTPCKICIKESRFCALHKHQETGQGT